jgi:hypothetical protein
MVIVPSPSRNPAAQIRDVSISTWYTSSTQLSMSSSFLGVVLLRSFAVYQMGFYMPYVVFKA